MLHFFTNVCFKMFSELCFCYSLLTSNSHLIRCQFYPLSKNTFTVYWCFVYQTFYVSPNIIVQWSKIRTLCWPRNSLFSSNPSWIIFIQKLTYIYRIMRRTSIMLENNIISSLPKYLLLIPVNARARDFHSFNY